MKKLYDVRLVVKEGEPQFQMRAPMSVIAQVYRLHREATQRAVRETETGGECKLFNCSGFDFIITEAGFDLGSVVPTSGDAATQPAPAGSVFDDHLSEMLDGDVVIIRKADGKWSVTTYSGAYVFVGHGATFEEAYNAEDETPRTVVKGARCVTASFYSAEGRWRPLVIHHSIEAAMAAGEGTHAFYHDEDADELTRISRKTKREYQCTGTGFDAVRKAVYEGIIDPQEVAS